MSLPELIAAALYADNLRQLNVINADRAHRHGYTAQVMTQCDFADADEHVRAMFLSYAKAALGTLEVSGYAIASPTVYIRNLTYGDGIGGTDT